MPCHARVEDDFLVGAAQFSHGVVNIMVVLRVVFDELVKFLRRHAVFGCQLTEQESCRHYFERHLTD